MGKNSPTESVGAAPEKETGAKVNSAPKFSVKRMGENCRQLFGVSSCTYAGATYGLTGEYTVEEMKAHIEKWRKKEAK